MFKIIWCNIKKSSAEQNNQKKHEVFNVTNAKLNKLKYCDPMMTIQKISYLNFFSVIQH